jgi:hypothetical protein
MHSRGRAKIPDLETRQRHAQKMQAACQQLETFTTALDDLIAQVESEMCLQPRKTRHSQLP